MSTTTVILLIAGIACYVGFVTFVLALLTVARRAGEAAEQHARELAARTDALCAAPHPRAAPGGRSPKFGARPRRAYTARQPGSHG